MPPAVGVAVFDFSVCQQAAVFSQPVDDQRIGLPNGHARQTRRVGNITTLRVDGVNQFDAVFDADKIVFQTVCGRGVHQARTGFGGNVFPVQQRDVAFQEGMAQMQIFQFFARGFGQHFEAV